MQLNNFFTSIEQVQKSKNAKNTIQAKARAKNMAYFGASIEKNKKMHYVLFYAKNASKHFMQVLELNETPKDRMRVNSAKAETLIKLFNNASKEEQAKIEQACNTIIDIESVKKKNAKIEQEQEQA